MAQSKKSTAIAQVSTDIKQALIEAAALEDISEADVIRRALRHELGLRVAKATVNL